MLLIITHTSFIQHVSKSACVCTYLVDRLQRRAVRNKHARRLQVPAITRQQQACPTGLHARARRSVDQRGQLDQMRESTRRCICIGVYMCIHTQLHTHHLYECKKKMCIRSNIRMYIYTYHSIYTHAVLDLYKHIHIFIHVYRQYTYK